MMRRYSIPFFVAYCGTTALGCGEVPRQEADVTAEISAALFAANPPVSEEIEIDAPTLERRISVEVKVAFGADEYLVVWSTPTHYPAAHMYGTRITKAGEVLDPSGFYIGPGYPSDLVFANGQFVVVSTPITGSPSGEIRATRVLPSGKVLDPDGVVVAEDDVDSLVDVYPTIASDGVDFLIAWTENWNSPKIYHALRMARMTANGVVLDPGGNLVTELKPWTMRPSLAFDGKQFLLAWGPNYDLLFAMRVSKSAQPLDPAPVVIDDVVGSHLNVKAIYDGANFIVGSGLENSANPILRLRRVDSNGTLDPATIDVPMGFPTASFSNMDFDGKQLVVAIDDTTLQKTFSLHVALDGNVVEQNPPLLAEKSLRSRVAANNSGEALFVWGEEAPFFDPLRGFATGARIDAFGTKLDSPPISISVRAAAESAPPVAFDGKNYLLAGRDAAGFSAVRVSTAGNVLGALALPFSAESLDKSNMPHVLSSGNSSGLTWIATTQSGATPSTRVVRVSSDGTLLDPVPFQLPPSNLGPLTTRQYVAGVDPAGALFVGAQDMPPSGPLSRPFAIRVTNDGSVEPLALIGDQSCVPHSLTFDGTAYFLTCSTPTGDYPSGDFEATLQGARISPKGELLEPGWKTLIKVPNTMFEWFEASFDGKNHWLFLRTEEWGQGLWPNFPRNVRLHALGITPTGELLAPEPILIAEADGCSVAAERSLRPAVASVNGNTLVVWSESSNPASCDSFHLDLLGVEIDSMGAMSPKFVVSAEPGLEDSPFLAAHPDGQMLVTYSRFVPDAPYAADRARARFITTCVCDDGKACVAGECASTSGGPNPPPKEPISFGGCGCRVSDDAPTNSLACTTALAALLAWKRRRERARA